MAEQNYTEEIDLSYLIRKMNDFIKKCIKAFFMIFGFFLKYWIITTLLLIIGIGYGYYLDINSKPVFKNRGLVIPNFESVDYFYNSIDEINNRINSQDTFYLKKTLGTHYKSLKKVEVEPVSDIYNLMTKSREQIDVFRILYQNQELDKFVDNISTGKYFKYHKITLTVAGENRSNEVIENLINSLNSNAHFLEYKDIYVDNAAFQVKEYKTMIAQVDSLIKTISSSTRNLSSGVVISENTDLHLLLEQKRKMLDELLQAEVRLNDYTEAIKLVYMDYEVKTGRIPYFIKLPALLIGLFAFVFFIRFVLKRMKQVAYS